MRACFKTVNQGLQRDAMCNGRDSIGQAVSGFARLSSVAERCRSGHKAMTARVASYDWFSANAASSVESRVRLLYAAKRTVIYIYVGNGRFSGIDRPVSEEAKQVFSGRTKPVRKKR